MRARMAPKSARAAISARAAALRDVGTRAAAAFFRAAVRETDFFAEALVAGLLAALARGERRLPVRLLGGLAELLV